MTSQQDTVSTVDATAQSPGLTQDGTGPVLPVLQQAVDILQRDTSGIPAQEDGVRSTAHDDDDDNEGYTSDESDDSPPPSMSSSMLERGEGNQPKVGVRVKADGDGKNVKVVSRPVK